MNKFIRTALILGPLIAVTPLSIDLYLPALPQIGAELGVPTSSVQFTLVAYLLAMAGGPILFGPLSDRIGRRVTILIGMSLYTLAALGCFFAPNVEWLAFGRFLQGLGGSSTQVCVRASVRDRYSGIDAARMFSIMMLILGLAPILAPLLGSYLLMLMPWRMLFLFFALVGLAAILIVLLPFQESLPRERRLTSGIGGAVWDTLRLFADRGFMTIVLVGAFAHAGFYTYLVASPGVMMEAFGMAPNLFAIGFAANAVALIGAAQVNVLLLRHSQPTDIARIAAVAYALATLTLVLFSFLGAPVLLFQAALLVCIGCLGFISANTAAAGLETKGDQAGSAAAVISLAQIGLGVLASSVVSAIGEASPLVMALAMTACALMSVSIALGARLACERDY